MVLKDVSFIVIARNESFAIDKCLESIASMPLKECEVICVDSDSTDNTIEVMKGYNGKIQNFRIIQCSGYVNAAIARNAGIKYSTKKYVFFVDVEIYADFISEALYRMELGKVDAVTGGLDEIVYSYGYKQIIKPRSHRIYYTREMEINFCGGTFLVRRQIMKEIGPFDERMDVNEDFDYSLRINRHGRFLAHTATMCTHHTLTYNKKPWLHFKKRYPMCFGRLIRKNIDCPKLLISVVLRENCVGLTWWSTLFIITPLFLVLSVPLLPVFAAFGLFALLDIFWGMVRKKDIITRLVAHYLHPLLIIPGIFLEFNQNRPATTTKHIV